MGKELDGTGIRYLTGKISDFRMYSRALPASEILAYIAETSAKGSQDRIIVLKSGKNGVKSIENINLYKDGDNATITRARGGIIQAVTNKSHYILPIKNDDGYARFLYKANLGNTILQNVRKTRSN